METEVTKLAIDFKNDARFFHLIIDFFIGFHPTIQTHWWGSHVPLLHCK